MRETELLEFQYSYQSVHLYNIVNKITSDGYDSESSNFICMLLYTKFDQTSSNHSKVIFWKPKCDTQIDGRILTGIGT